MPKLTPEQLAEIAGRCEKATLGPYQIGFGYGGVTSTWAEELPEGVHLIVSKGIGMAFGASIAAVHADELHTAELFVASRTDIPSLLTHIKALEEENRALRNTDAHRLLAIDDLEKENARYKEALQRLDVANSLEYCEHGGLKFLPCSYCDAQMKGADEE